MDLKELFGAVSQRMRSDFEASRIAIQHRGRKGTAREDIVIDFLKRFLPNHLDIGSGEIVDSYGKVSREVDVIIFDAMHTPKLYYDPQTVVVPIECVYAVVEVKTTLDPTELEKCITHMHSIKTLKKNEECFQRSSYWKDKSACAHGEIKEHWPVYYFIFSFNGSSLQKIWESFNNHYSKEPPDRRIDMVCIEGETIFLNEDYRGVQYPFPTADTSPKRATNKEQLVWFFALILSVLCKAEMPSFHLAPYLNYLGHHKT